MTTIVLRQDTAAAAEIRFCGFSTESIPRHILGELHEVGHRLATRINSTATGEKPSSNAVHLLECRLSRS